jgi:hypothetical protein
MKWKTIAGHVLLWFSVLTGTIIFVRPPRGNDYISISGVRRSTTSSTRLAAARVGIAFSPQPTNADVCFRHSSAYFDVQPLSRSRRPIVCSKRDPHTGSFQAAQSRSTHSFLTIRLRSTVPDRPRTDRDRLSFTLHGHELSRSSKTDIPRNLNVISPRLASTYESEFASRFKGSFYTLLRTMSTFSLHEVSRF